MNDRFLSISLIIIFGLSGLALLAAAWSMPFLYADRATACIGGLVGIGFAVIRMLMLRREIREEAKIPATVEVPSSSDMA